MTKAVLGRLVDLNKFVARRAPLSDDYAAMLHDAREARNYIAHDAADELKRIANDRGGIDEWPKVLASKLQELALGKIILAVLLSMNSAEPTPTRETIDSYSKRIESWVLDGDA